MRFFRNIFFCYWQMSLSWFVWLNIDPSLMLVCCKCVMLLLLLLFCRMGALMQLADKFVRLLLSINRACRDSSRKTVTICCRVLNKKKLLLLKKKSKKKKLSIVVRCFAIVVWSAFWVTYDFAPWNRCCRFAFLFPWRIEDSGDNRAEGWGIPL